MTRHARPLRSVAPIASIASIAYRASIAVPPSICRIALLGALSVGLAAIPGALPSASPADWPGWRGPRRDGSTQAALPATWPRELPRAWSVEVGEGYSGPVVVSGRIVVLARRGDDEVILGLDPKDGSEAWKLSYPAPYTPEQYAKPHGKGPFATPAMRDGKVWTVGIAGTVSCVDAATGKLLWRRDFKGEFAKPWPMWGASGSPLIEGDLLLLNIGREDDGAIAALDRNTGKTVWTVPDLDPAYSSPVAADLAGTRQVVFLTREKLAGISPADGKVLWERPYRVQYEQNAITPVVVGDLVVCSGWQKPTECVRISRDGNSHSARPVWSNEELTFFMSTPVAHEKTLFGFAQRDKGSLVALGLEDGKRLWSSPGRMGEYASIVKAGDRLLVLLADGRLLVVAADPTAYRLIHEVRVSDEPTWAHLAVAGGRLYVKDRLRLIAFDLGGE